MATTLDQVARLIPGHANALRAPGVFSIRPGYFVRDGWVSREPAIVVTVDRRLPNPTLPARIGGVPVDVRRATPFEQLRFENRAAFARLAAYRPELRGGAFPEFDPNGAPIADGGRPAAGAPAPTKPGIPYTAPDGVSLDRVTDTLTITCSASPDAGWPTLKPFLSTVGSRLTVGMYDFTSRHILDTVTAALQSGKGLTLTLDDPPRNPTADQSDSQTRQILQTSVGNAARLAWALVETNSLVPEWIFPSAYHIKVAVKDGQSFWLSSGNWNNSNQPDVDPIQDPSGAASVALKSDRDWHVIVEHAGLAQTFEAYLAHDYQVAASVESGPATAGLGVGPEIEAGVPAELEGEAPAPATYFPPLVLRSTAMTVQPLLTPDNYHGFMLDLIQSASTSLYVQLQYIHPSDLPEDADFSALVDAVAQKMQAGKDVRVIVSQYQASNGWLEKLQSVGFDLSLVRLQPRCHNKGFVVDGQVVAIGSQNWSGDGALRNRDASLIIYHEAVAQYFQQIFLHDWETMASQQV